MIHIFFRHYNVGNTNNSSRHDERYQARANTRWGNIDFWFSYEKTFLNLLRTTKDKNVKINVVMDGLIDENWISKYKQRFTTHEIVAGTDWKSFHSTMHIIKNDSSINQDDVVYILENDYIHLDNWVEKVEELYSTYGDNLSYVSLYDHLDKYVYSMYSNLVSKIIITRTHHWRTTPSTTGTFMLRKKLFDEDYDVQSTSTEDHNKFIWLTQNRGRHVLTPIPGLSTHCVIEYSPTINWEEVMNKEQIEE